MVDGLAGTVARPVAWRPGDDRVLVTIQSGQFGPPLYCFHPLTGSAAVYGALAFELGRRRPVRGLQSIGLTPGREPDTTVPAMAARYADAIAAHGPGRHVLLGYSMGGVLAVETARLMAEGPGPRPSVVLLDADPVHVPAGPGSGWVVLVEQAFGLDGLSPVELAAMPRPEALAAVRAAAVAAGKLPGRFSLDRLGLMLEICAVNDRAAANHLPMPFPGVVHSVRSSTHRVDAWTGFAERVVVHRVDTSHHGVMTAEAMPRVAAVLRPLLDSTTGTERDGDHV